MEFKVYKNDRKRVAHENTTCKRQTQAAILVTIQGQDVWVPQSAIDDDSEVYREGTSGRLVIKAWIAQRNGWWDGVT